MCKMLKMYTFYAKKSDKLKYCNYIVITLVITFHTVLKYNNNNHWRNKTIITF